MRVVTRHVADPIGSAPAQYLQESIRRLSGVSLAHLVQSGRILQRCGAETSLAARVMAANAALGEALGNAVAPPRRKAKNKRRQSVDGELNFTSLNFAERR